MAVPEMVKAVRAGRGLYLLNLRQRLELESDVRSFIPELDGRCLDEDEAQLASLSLFHYSRPVKLKHQIDHELGSLLWEQDIWSHPLESHGSRKRLEEGAKEIAFIEAPNAVEICSAIIHGSRPVVDYLLELVDLSEIRGPVSAFDGFHVIHVASLTPNPQIMSALLKSGLDR